MHVRPEPAGELDAAQAGEPVVSELDDGRRLQPVFRDEPDALGRRGTRGPDARVSCASRSHGIQSTRAGVPFSPIAPIEDTFPKTE